MNESINQSTNQVNESVNESMNQSISQSVSQFINLCLHLEAVQFLKRCSCADRKVFKWRLKCLQQYF